MVPVCRKETKGEKAGGWETGQRVITTDLPRVESESRCRGIKEQEQQ